MKIRIGTRASALASWQAQWVADQLAIRGGHAEIVPISTAGDRSRTGPIDEIGSQGVFTKEIQAALLDGRIDIAVHSLKDLATEPVPGLCLAAVPERGPIGDVLVFRGGAGGPLDRLPERAAVGTGSPRRKAQLLHSRPDLRVENIRGNVETRLAKLDEGQFDALVLAEAGLRRLELDGRVGAALPTATMLPAVGQGALGIESRADNAAIHELLQAIDDAPSHAAVAAERAMLAALEGGCLAPVAGWGRIERGLLRLQGRVLSLDGARQIEATLDGRLEEPESLGRLVARRLDDEGAAELILAARQP
ncbi:MAG TPA: hydroxymethylbilane synthase [Planctomycetaceae bacterium]|nr:hydroxymethylbilane synthase [Planctomycetaceae bacterium]